MKSNIELHRIISLKKELKILVDDLLNQTFLGTIGKELIRPTTWKIFLKELVPEEGKTINVSILSPKSLVSSAETQYNSYCLSNLNLILPVDLSQDKFLSCNSNII